jgi:hypothetical protein
MCRRAPWSRLSNLGIEQFFVLSCGREGFPGLPQVATPL